MRSVIRRDPAPSRLAYRLSRFWASRRVRKVVTVWLPLGAVLLGAGALVLHPSQQERLHLAYAAVHGTIVNHPSFALERPVIRGAAPDTQAQLEAALAEVLPASALTLDLDALKHTLEALTPVAAIELDVAGDGILSIEVTERSPVALIRHQTALVLTDLSGTLIREVHERASYPELPVLLGKGAEEAVPEALDILHAAQPLSDRIIGLVRVGERRWTLHLDRNQSIALPEEGAIDALLHVLALHRSQDLLSRDVTVIDMRNPNRPVMRLTENAVREVRRMRAFRPEEDA